jgi:hypothetical protein
MDDTKIEERGRVGGSHLFHGMYDKKIEEKGEESRAHASSTAALRELVWHVILNQLEDI